MSTSSSTRAHRPEPARRRFWTTTVTALAVLTGTLTLASAASAAAACVPVTTSDSGYSVLTFPAGAACDWSVPAYVTAASVLVVAGGGGGAAGGGGAGGLLYRSAGTGNALSLTPGATVSVTVGAGGAARNSTGVSGVNGADSAFGAVTATGGGGGGSPGVLGLLLAGPGLNGGSGGGGGLALVGSTAGGTGVAGQGYAGAVSTVATGAGGGGGSGGTASTGTPGPGSAIAIASGTATTYAIGGAGSTGYVYPGAAPGADNPSVGGGGRADSSSSTNGKAGTVVVRYRTPVAPVFTASTPPGSGISGTAYAGYTFAASGLPAPTFAVASGSLPPGMSLDSSTGVLSGTPAGTGAQYSFTVSATNPLGTATTPTRTVSVAAPPVLTASTPAATAVVGTPYTFTFTATGYPAPVFGVVTGGLPAGLALDPVSGVLSGTPTSAGASTFTVSATNASGTVGSPSRTITVSPAAAAPVLVASTPPAGATAGTAYAGYTFTATGYPAPTFAVSGGSLPAGLALSAGGGLSGTPTSAGVSTFTVSATNASGTVSTATRTITVDPAPAGPVFTAAAPPATATVGTPYAGYTFAASGYPAPVFAVATGSLPAGLTLDTATGQLSGTPTGTGGAFAFTVSATNPTAAVSSSPRTITVTAGPALTASSPPVSATVASAYPDYTFTATGYPAPTFAVASGSLPAGLSLNAGTGVLSGVPVSAGSSTFTVSATNTGGTVSTAPITIAVNPAPAAPVLTASSPPAAGTVGATYSGYTFTASGYPAPIFAVASGALPAGLALDPFTGVLAGTPTAAGVSTFTVSATNASGAVSTPSRTITVSPAPAAPSFTASTPPTTGTVGTVYPAYTFTASGYPAPVFAVGSGSLPAGLGLSSTGVLSGTPSAAGSSSFTVTATNAVTGVSTSTITVVVSPAPAAPSFTASTPPSTGTVGTAYAGYTFTASGYPAATFAVASGQLPGGLSLSSAGVLAGTPTTPGPSAFTVSATNTAGAVSTGTRTVVISPAAAAPAFTSAAPPVATVGAPYSHTFTASGYPAPAFTVTTGTLPPGLTLSPAGVLSGTPTTAATTGFTVTAANGTAPDATSTVSLVVDPAPVAPAAPVFTGPAPGPATAGSSYTHTFTATGVPAPTFSTTGPLPAGLTLTAGVLAGTPTTAGTTTFTVTAANGVGTDATRPVTLIVAPAPVAPLFTGAAPGPATIGTAYSHTFTASGYPAATFSTTDPLPVGLTLSSAGLLSGTPSSGTAGGYTVTVSASNGTAPDAAEVVTLTVVPAPQAPAFPVTPVPPGATAGTAYSYGFAATGHPVPTFSVTAGSLPAGLSLNSGTGVLSGTPSGLGASTFTVTATNSNGTASSGPLTVSVTPAAAAPAIAASTPGSATVGTPYSHTFTATGYPAATFSTSDPLPVGLGLSSAGQLSGTVATGTAGTYPVTVTATNAGGTDSVAIVLTVTPAPAAPAFPVTPVPAGATIGTAYSYAFAPTGYPAPTLAVTAGSLPAGLTLDPASWVLSGTPTGAGGTSTFTVTATSSGGTASTGPISLTVDPAAAAPVLTAMVPGPATATVGTAYSYTFTASGYPAPVFSTSDPLPVGLTLSSSGVLSGTPAAGTSGTYAFVVVATNASGTDSGPATLTVTPPASAPAFPVAPVPAPAVLGSAYSYTFAPDGYPRPSFALATGTLPPGLTLDPVSGTLSGTATSVGLSTFRISATNPTSTVTTGPITFRVNPVAAAPLLSGTAPASVTIGTPYSHTFATTGFPLPAVTSPSPLPAGLSLSPAGVLTGTAAPGTAGTYPLTLTADNGIGSAAVAPYTLTVVPAPPSPPSPTPATLVAATPPASGTVGAAYSYTFTATGLPAPTFAVASGSLPAGMSLAAVTGVLSGLPTIAGAANFTVSATNTVATDVSAPITVTVAAAPVPPGGGSSGGGNSSGGSSGGGGTSGTTVPPAGVSLQAGTSSLIPSWTSVPGATGYTATASPGPAACTTAGTSCVLGASAGTTYTVTVVAHLATTDTGPSQASNPATPTAPVVPPSPPADAPDELTTDIGPIGLAVPGEDLTAVGARFAAHSSVTVVIYSSPVVLGTTVADSAGRFSLPVTVPAGIAAGRHTLLATGVDRSGAVHRIALPITVADLSASSADGSPLIPFGGRLTLLDEGGRPVTSAGVAEGTYALVSSARAIRFTPVRGFTGTATRVGYRLQDALGKSVTGTYTAVVGAAVGEARLPLPARVVSSTGSPAAVVVPCSLSTGSVATCSLTATVTIDGARVVVGRAKASAPAAPDVSTLKVRVPLTERGRALTARAGGVRVTFLAVVLERGQDETTSVTGTTTVVAQRFALPRTAFFSGDSDDLTGAGKDYLRGIRGRLAGMTSVSCVGYADAPGDAGSARALATRRAVAVCRLLAGDDDVTVRATGTPVRKPAGGPDAAGKRALNRRVVVTVVNVN